MNTRNTTHLHEEERSAAATLLRRETAPLHRQLDQHPLIRGLMKPGFNAQQHVQLLKSFQHAYHQIEPTILHYEAQHAVKGPGYTARLPCLNAVLSEEAEKTPLGEAQIPLSAAQYWGRRYVLDGSCHGARLVLPKLSDILGNSAPSLSYWRLLAEQAAIWPDVTSALNAFCDGQTLHAECVAAARDTFNRFIAALHDYLI